MIKIKPHVPLNEQPDLGKEKKPKKAKPTPAEQLAEEMEKDPGIVKLKQEMSLLYRLPRLRELTQLAGLLATDKDFKDSKKTVALAGRALALWSSCATRLREEIKEAIELEKSCIANEREPILSDLEIAMHYPEDFPLDFEKALLLIVGGKVRRTERYKVFRDFTRDTFRQHAKDDAALEKLVADKFASLKANGFEYNPFGRAAALFEGWKATRASRKASKAAQMRWSKK